MLQKTYSTYKDKGLLLLAAFAKSKKEEIVKFTERFHLTYPVGQENGIAKVLEVKGLPATIFIAKDGRVTKQVIGRISQEELTASIEEILL